MNDRYLHSGHPPRRLAHGRAAPTPDELKAFYANEYFQASHGTYAPDYTEAELAHRDLIARTLLFAVQTARGRRGRRPVPGGRMRRGLAAGGGAGGRFRGHRARLLRRRPKAVPSGAAAARDVRRRLREPRAPDRRRRAVRGWWRWSTCWSMCWNRSGCLSALPLLIAPGGVCAITVPNDFSPLQLAGAQGRPHRPRLLARPAAAPQLL
ncbi:MAG: hypothetical protein WDM85_14480 [Caulobacteraceae bacterium]